MRNAKLAALTIAVAVPLLATSAGATIVVQAGAGHPHLTSGSVSWDSEWATGNSFTIIDGRTIQSNGTVARMWDTPIPITSTNATWNVEAIGLSDPGGAVQNRICTFDNLGNFSTCGALVVAQTSAAPSSTAFVPPNGSAYSQTFFIASTVTRQIFNLIAF